MYISLFSYEQDEDQKGKFKRRRARMLDGNSGRQILNMKTVKTPWKTKVPTETRCGSMVRRFRRELNDCILRQLV